MDGSQTRWMGMDRWPDMWLNGQFSGQIDKGMWLNGWAKEWMD